MTPTATSALATVERHGPLTPSELAEIERVKRPTATRTLGCLEGRAWSSVRPIRRRPQRPGRVNAAGRERLRRLRGRKNVYLARRMRDLPAADIEALERAAEILEKMRAPTITTRLRAGSPIRAA